MSDNKFFLRDDYNQKEKENRIRAKEFTIDNPPVMNILKKTGISPDQVNEMTRDDFLNTVRKDLSKSQYDDFIDEMFDKYGREGDRFNQQLFFIPPDADISNLDEKLERFTDVSLNSPFEFILTQPLYLNEVENNGNTIDLRFNTSVRIEEYESGEDIPITILDEEGDLINKLDEDQKVNIPTQKRVEARIYKNERIISISNSEVPDGLQGEIFQVIVSLVVESPEITYPKEGGDD